MSLDKQIWPGWWVVSLKRKGRGKKKYRSGIELHKSTPFVVYFTGNSMGFCLDGEGRSWGAPRANELLFHMYLGDDWESPEPLVWTEIKDTKKVRHYSSDYDGYDYGEDFGDSNQEAMRSGVYF